MTKEQIDAMVNRFLQWKLPADFDPDCGITFDKRPADAQGYARQWPVGTNLFTATQARAMVEHMLSAMQPSLIEMGFGRVEVGAGTFGGKRALIFGRNGRGLGVYHDYRPEGGKHVGDDECIVTITFENLEGLLAIKKSLEIVEEKFRAGQPAEALVSSHG